MATVVAAPFIGGLKGRLGTVYFAETPHGTELRSLPVREAARTPGELAQQARVRRVAAAWRALSGEEMLAWGAYDPEAASPYNAFLPLASKILQLGRDRAIPTSPPSAAFFGDALSVTAAGVAQGEPLEGGGVRFTATRANAPGVVTELLLQPLANAARRPRPKAFVSQGFVAFADEDLGATVPVAPGWYACAYRFVLEATGQETNFAPCGVARVGASS